MVTEYVAERKDTIEGAETEDTSLQFPEPVIAIVKDAALKRIKKGAEYQCINGHRFKGKDVVVEFDLDADVLTVQLNCPECGIDKILLPNPVLVLNMNLG